MEPQIFEKTRKEARQLLSQFSFEAALPLYQKLTRSRPRDAELWYEYGVAAVGAHSLRIADRALAAARELGRNDVDLTLRIGHVFQNMRRWDCARECYLRSSLLDAQGIDPRISLGALLERQGHIDQARTVVAECLLKYPKDEQAIYVLALLDFREKKIENAESLLRDLIASEPKHQYVRYASRYLLAAILDATERYDEAMVELSKAKSLVHELADIQTLLRDYDRMIERQLTQTNDVGESTLEKWSAMFPPKVRNSLPSLAFLGGHPRSGTTLLEAILGSHPSVLAFDETDAQAAILLPEFHKIRNPSAARINVVRRLYMERLQNQTAGSCREKVFLDKNPSGTAFLPTFLRVFPELRVIIALRDPRDVLISCYFQNMILNKVNANFLSFNRLAKHYANLMNVWLTVRRWNGLSWIEARYEDMVADTNAEGRRITEFINLNWDKGQNSFYEAKGKQQIYSPTYHDVRKPIHSSSICRWQRYHKHLEPVLESLAPYCMEFGYAK